MKKLLFLAGLVILAVNSQAQVMKSNIYVFDMKLVMNEVYQFSNPRYLTFFNKDGYNNQPAFINSNELFISVETPENPGQTDIYDLNLADNTKLQVTETPQSEFSPMVTPDYFFFSVIREETGEDSTRWVWQYPIDRTTGGRPLFNNIKNVSYYAWIDENKIAINVDGSSPQLVVLDATADKVIKLSKNIGRCFQRLPNGNLAYVQKATADTWFIKELDVNTYTSKIIFNTLPGVEDFAVLNNGTFLMGKGSRLYKYTPETDSDWVQIVNLSAFGITGITRIAVSDDWKVAVVTEL